MVTVRFVSWAALLVVCGSFSFAAADDETTFFSDCADLQLSLDGADYYRWIEPGMGRVVLNRQCVATETDCDHDVVTVWDAEGRQIFEAAPFLDTPEMSDGHVLDATLRTPDRLVASVLIGGADFPFALAEYDVGTGELLRVVQTGSIQCPDLRGDAEGATWCLGVNVVNRRNDDDYDLVYRFDGSGALQGHTLPRSTYPQTLNPLSDTGRWSGRGGFLPGDGPVRLWLPAVGELISFDGEGAVVDRLSLPVIENLQRPHLVSGTDTQVYAMLVVGDEKSPDEWTQALYRLADVGAAWMPLEGSHGPVPMRMTLVGADDAGLVLLDRTTLTLCHLPYGTENDPGE